MVQLKAATPWMRVTANKKIKKYFNCIV